MLTLQKEIEEHLQDLQKEESRRIQPFYLDSLQKLIISCRACAPSLHQLSRELVQRRSHHPAATDRQMALKNITSCLKYEIAYEPVSD